MTEKHPTHRAAALPRALPDICAAHAVGTPHPQPRSVVRACVQLTPDAFPLPHEQTNLPRCPPHAPPTQHHSDILLCWFANAPFTHRHHYIYHALTRCAIPLRYGRQSSRLGSPNTHYLGCSTPCATYQYVGLVDWFLLCLAMPCNTTTPTTTPYLPTHTCLPTAPYPFTLPHFAPTPHTHRMPFTHLPLYTPSCISHVPLAIMHLHGTRAPFI